MFTLDSKKNAHLKDFLRTTKLQFERARFNLAAWGKTTSVQFIRVGSVHVLIRFNELNRVKHFCLTKHEKFKKLFPKV